MLEAREEQAEADVREGRARIYGLAAAVRAMIWSKHPPSYERMFPKDRERKKMTDDEMYAQVRALNAMFGGKEA